MDTDLGDHERLFATTARQALTPCRPGQASRPPADETARQLCELASQLGWGELAVDDHPQVGEELVMLGLLFHELGAAAAPLGLLPSVLATQVLRLAPHLDAPGAGEDGALAFVRLAAPRPQLAHPPVRVSGPVGLVELAPDVRQLLVAVGEPGDDEHDVVAVDRDHPGVRSVPVEVMDGAPVARLDLAEVPGEAVGAVPSSVVDRVEVMGRLLRSAAMLGAGTAMHDLAMAHIRSRHQFGRPIGSFQAARHLAVDAWTRLVAARLAVLEALSLEGGTLEAGSLEGSSPDAGGRGAGRRGATAVVAAADAARAASHASSQLLGGLGFMLEHPLPAYFTYVGAHRARLGPAARLLREVASRTSEELAEGRRLRLWDGVG